MALQVNIKENGNALLKTHIFTTIIRKFKSFNLSISKQSSQMKYKCIRFFFPPSNKHIIFNSLLMHFLLLVHFYNNIILYETFQLIYLLPSCTLKKFTLTTERIFVFSILKKWKKYMFVQQITFTPSLPMKNFSKKNVVHKKENLV